MLTSPRAFERLLLLLMLGALAVLAVGFVFLGWPVAPAALVLLAQTVVAVHTWALGVSGRAPWAGTPHGWALAAGAWAGVACALVQDPARGLLYGALVGLLLAAARPPARS